MTIVGCFLEFDGRFLILLRHNHKPQGGTWGLPAGKVEPGEDNATAMLRELHEETGYRASPEKLEHLGNFEFGDKDSSYSFATYRVKADRKPTLQIEKSAHAAQKWVTAEECYAIPKLIDDLHDLLKRTGYID